MTAAIAVPVWLATRPHLNDNVATVQSLDVPAVRRRHAQIAARPRRPDGCSARPLVASMAPLPPPRRAAAGAVAELHRRQLGAGRSAPTAARSRRACWLPGSSAATPPARSARVVLGNSTAVEVQQAGKTVDLTPFSRANVARFTVSSDGSLAPVAD